MIRELVLSGILIILVSSAIAGDSMKPEKEIQQFIQTLDDQCAYDDGYICQSTDPNFFSPQSHQALLPAIYLQAWAVALNAFQQLPELKQSEKNLKHYKIGFSEKDDQYIVLFSPIFLPYFIDGAPQGVSTGTYGKAVKFWIDKDSLGVTKFVYLK